MIKQHIQKTLLICFFGIVLSGCGNAETMRVQSQETKIETTTPVKAVSETQTQVDKEIKKAETAQKVYTENDYKQFFDDEYFAGLKIDGNNLVVSYYEEKEVEYEDENGWTYDTVIDKSSTYQEIYSKEQADYILNKGNDRQVDYANSMINSDKTGRLITGYTLMNGQKVDLPEGKRILIGLQNDIAAYYVELMLSGQNVNTVSGKTLHEQTMINIQKNKEQYQLEQEKKRMKNAAKAAERKALFNEQVEKKKSEWFDKFGGEENYNILTEKSQRTNKLVEKYNKKIIELNKEYVVYSYLLNTNLDQSMNKSSVNLKDCVQIEYGADYFTASVPVGFYYVKKEKFQEYKEKMMQLVNEGIAEGEALDIEREYNGKITNVHSIFDPLIWCLNAAF